MGNYVNNGAAFGLIGALVASAMAPDKHFDFLDEREAKEQMSTRNLVAISPEAKAYVTQEVPPFPSQPTPNRLNIAKNRDGIEEQLAELKHIRDKGLITKAEYDAKRKQLLDKIY